MATRHALLESIATTIADYRAGEIEPRTPVVVERWATQFDEGVQVPLLSELDHVLKQTYYSKSTVRNFLEDLVTNVRTIRFWKKANFLNVQQNGNSQRELLVALDEVLSANCGLTTAGCGHPSGPFIYLDDAIFTGKRAADDLKGWIASTAPPKATVYVIAVAAHAGGEYLLKQRIKEAASDAGKSIAVKIWKAEAIENRKYHKNDAGVLWPSSLPKHDLVDEYQALAHRYPFEPRRAGGSLGPFSSERSRQLLEHEMLVAGLEIRAACQNPKDAMRPLGWGFFGLGFGATIVSYRNCPNNCPLALWWGDPEATSGSLKWFPLLPRKTYSSNAADFDFDFDDLF